MNANAEKMEDLLNDLDFKFDVLAVTETWNCEKNKFSPHCIEGYHQYYGNTGSSGKGGCGFYINDTLNYIERKDLEIRIKENFC